MFIRRGSLADVRRHICSRLRYALQCKMFATDCAIRYGVKILRRRVGEVVRKGR